jgi:hypothetical protein
VSSHPSQTDQLELVTVQLDECKDLFRRESIAHDRIAFILVDSAVELIMNHKIRCATRWNAMHKASYTALKSARDSASAQLEESAKKYVTATKMKEIERDFGKKIDFLVGQDLLPSALGASIRKLHGYRNEIYHRQRIRHTLLRTVTFVYFDIAATLLAGYDEPGTGSWLVWDDADFRRLHPAINAHTGGLLHDAGMGPADKRWGTTAGLAAAVSDSLLADPILGIPALKGRLTSYILDQVDEMLRAMKGARELLPMFEDWNTADMLRFAQMIHAMPGSQNSTMDLERMRSRNWKYKMKNLDNWQSRAEALATIESTPELYEEFASIADEVEACAALVKAMAIVVDDLFQYLLDRARGK